MPVGNARISADGYGILTNPTEEQLEKARLAALMLPQEYINYSNNSLKEMCKVRGLKVSARNKDEYILRLKEYDVHQLATAANRESVTSILTNQSSTTVMDSNKNTNIEIEEKCENDISVVANSNNLNISDIFKAAVGEEESDDNFSGSEDGNDENMVID